MYVKKKVKIMGNVLFFGGLGINLILMFTEFLIPKWLMVIVYVGIFLRGISEWFFKDS